MSPLGFSTGTTLADAQQNLRARAASWTDELNSQSQAWYDQAVRNFDANMESGQKHDPPLVPPVAPFAYVVGPPDGNGFVFPILSNSIRLTPTPPLVVDTVDVGNLSRGTQSGEILIGKQDGDTKWYSALHGDGFPSGMTTPRQDDGHTYEKFGAPVGPGWYLRLD